MTTRAVLVGAWVAFVAALAVYATAAGPADNDLVYHHDTEVDISVDVIDPAFDVTVAGVSSRQLAQAQLGGPAAAAAAAVVVTVTPTTAPPGERPAIDAEAATLTGIDDHVVRPATVQGGDLLDVGIPTVVTLEVGQPLEVMEGGSFNIVSTTPTVPVEVTVPIVASDQPIAIVTAQLTPIPVTGHDLGIAGAVDIPDQRLPGPAVGEPIPSRLDDGRPVWVIGLDDTVAVLDARSPHRHSGLVGWCGSMPGFIDSIGGSRFTATGEYRFGPAPHGLVPYAVEVAEDHVIITHRLPPSPRPQTSRYVDHFPRIEGSPVEQGPYCDIDTDLAQQAQEDGAFLEDFRGDPTWVQHDLADWPSLDGATGDGWFRTDEHHLADGPHLVGDLLVHRQRGVIVDAASPPGTARSIIPSDPAEPTTVTGRYLQAGRHGDGLRTIEIQPVLWVTATGISAADTPPTDPDRHLVSTAPSHGYQLADDVQIEASPGDVLTVTIVDQQVTGITSVG